MGGDGERFQSYGCFFGDPYLGLVDDDPGPGEKIQICFAKFKTPVDMLRNNGHDFLPHRLQADEVRQEKKDDQKKKEKPREGSRCPKEKFLRSAHIDIRKTPPDDNTYESSLTDALGDSRLPLEI